MTKTIQVAILVCVVLLLASVTFAQANTKKTVENLQAAYNGESNANARYLAFAKQADKEGYGEVASLFRAAAKAEEIHANNHAEVIKKLGGTPAKKIDAPDVKTTKENLQNAIKGESYERDTMYPDFIKEAKSQGNADAVRTFNLAKTAEAEHAKLYTDALNNLDKLKGSKAKNWYVCGVCGFTAAKIDFAKCPSCFAPKEKYQTVA